MKEIKLLPLASGSLNMFENLVNYERDKTPSDVANAVYLFENLVNYERDKTSIKFPSASNTFENLVNYERDKTKLPEGTYYVKV